MELFPKKFVLLEEGVIVMKKNLLVIFFSLGMLLLSACNSETIVMPNGNENLYHTISVTGVGESEMKPDTAYVTVNVTVEKEDAKSAQEEAKRVMTSIYSDLETLTIGEEHLSTTGYSINVLKDYSDKYISKSNPSPYKITGYRVDNSIEIEINDTDSVGKVIDQVVRKEHVTIRNLNFGLSDDTTAKNEAIKQATEHAKKEAEIVAESLGVEIKKVKEVRIQNTNSHYPNYKRGYVEEMAYDTAKSSTPVSTQTIKTNANVEIVFIIE